MRDAELRERARETKDSRDLRDLKDARDEWKTEERDVRAGHPSSLEASRDGYQLNTLSRSSSFTSKVTL